MKTSNKLLLGLFVIVIAGMVALNFALHDRFKPAAIQRSVNVFTYDSTFVATDSLTTNLNNQ